LQLYYDFTDKLICLAKYDYSDHIDKVVKSSFNHNLKTLELEFSKSDINKEIVAVQSLHQLIKESRTLETVILEFNISSNLVLILDSCQNKPNVEFLKLVCTEELSSSVCNHVKM